MEQVVIRGAEPSDHPAILDVFRRSSWSNEGDREFLLANPHVLAIDDTAIDDGRLRVATVEGRIVGFASATPGPEALELDDLFVDPDWMRHGVGRQLMADVVTRAADAAIPCVEVTANDHALDFYRRVGFVVVGKASTMAGSALRLRLTLAAPASEAD